MQKVQATTTEAKNEVFVGKKPIMVYVSAALLQLSNEPEITIKARGMSIPKAVDVSQIMIKKMDKLGYEIKKIELGSEQLQSQDGKVRNVSTVEITIRGAR